MDKNQKKLILGFNWKQNPTSHKQAVNLLQEYKSPLAENSQNLVVAFPPTIYLSDLNRQKIDHKINLELGSQDISEFESGANTAELSPVSVKDCGANFTLVGHSETRKQRKLSNQEVNQKVLSALKTGIIPFLCIGYSNNLETTEINYQELADQIILGLQNVRNYLEKGMEVIIAYEPVWAIGTGKTADPATISKVHEFIGNTLVENFGEDLRSKLWLIYGGSVNGSNCQELAKIENVDGFLIGGASLKPEEVAKILEILS